MSLHDSVPQVPTYEEFYGLIDNEISDDEFDSDEKDEEIKKMIVLALSLLQDFYLEVQYYSEYDVVSEEFEKKLADFNVELKEAIMSLFKEYMDNTHTNFDVEYKLPSGIVTTEFDIKNVLNGEVDGITNMLRDDIQNKANFYKDVAITTGIFSLHANFRRAIRKLTNVVGNNANYVHERIHRSYYELVYGQEALFYWVCSGINTCAWCYSIEAMGAMPLSWFPVDHPNGNCVLKPAYPDTYSEEYLKLMGEI